MNSSEKSVLIGLARARASEIRTEITDLETRRLALEVEAGKIDSAVEAFERLKAGSDGEGVACQCSSTGDESSVKVGRRIRYMTMAREVDYSGTNDQIDRIIRVAEATADGIINTTHVAEKLIEDGMSTSRKVYLRGTVQSRLAKHDDFEKIASGTYRYLAWVEDQHATE